MRDREKKREFYKTQKKSIKTTKHGIQYTWIKNKHF